MFQDLDDTLEMLLSQEISGKISPLLNISFATPDAESIGKKPAINLFLYDVRENLELRSGIESFQRQPDATAVRMRAPIWVDCSYLITVWPQESDASGTRLEHQLLGHVMKALSRHRKLPPEVLRGELQGQDPPVRAVSMQTGPLSSMGEFWQAMGGKPKVAINYTVTISVPVHDEGETVPLVTEASISG